METSGGVREFVVLTEEEEELGGGKRLKMNLETYTGIS